ncbi:hypothetical protein [Herbiconiux solani]|uniref:hypothetical protein n=1 Tax=Herbiconiux solani TaxID=661329 RepID=UPI00082552CF|nr:hypothetical protein [Herbiconiux solani]
MTSYSPPATATAAGIADAPHRSHRILAVSRLQLSNRMSVFGVPWMILGFIFLVNLVIWWIIYQSVADPADRTDALEGLQYSGASFYFFVYMLVLGVLSMAQYFPLALGLSATRREFWFGTSLVFVLLSVLYGVGFTVLATIERATEGWGFGGRMFTVVYFGGWDAPWYTRLLLFTSAFLFFFFVGAAIATIYQRWRVNGMLAFFATLGVVLVGAAVLITLGSGWPAVGAWFASTGAAGVVAWGLIPTAVAAVVGYLVLRRATPRG